jgi:Protein of unknown function (DUF3788)
MENILLREKEILPTNEVIEKALGNSYRAYEKLTEIVTGTSFGLILNWNYYNDGKAWLCKVCFKKKTIFWLSVWDQYFKTGFYFTEKTGQGLNSLNIDENIKETFWKNKPIGKLIPLGISVTGIEQIDDILRIIEYKKSLK